MAAASAAPIPAKAQTERTSSAIRDKAKSNKTECCIQMPEIMELVLHEYKSATNMTEQFAALGAIAQNAGDVRDEVLSDFYQKWKEDALVIIKWLALQAVSDILGNVKNVQRLLEHPAFDIRNPNKVYSLIGGFSSSSVNFHAKMVLKRCIYVLFGRIPLCDFILEHPTISQYHAVLQYKGNGDVFIYDLGSTHGTIVNKIQVTPNIYKQLHVGDIIRFGTSSCLYVLQGPTELMPP